MHSEHYTDKELTDGSIPYSSAVLFENKLPEDWKVLCKLEITDTERDHPGKVYLVVCAFSPDYYNLVRIPNAYYFSHSTITFLEFRGFDTDEIHMDGYWLVS